ncbi:MAG: hypothetical protein HYY06_32290 [Deltaproteobacteria bacterium]|nr:hypothetical protein [Deltaproteobacteria bacterium]
MPASRRTFVKSLVIGAVGAVAGRARAQDADPFATMHRAADPAHPTPEERAHAPALTVPARVRSGRAFDLGIAVGAPLHESSAEHHIEWIEVRVGSRQVARLELAPAGAQPLLRVRIVLGESAPVRVMAMCSRHGLWETTRTVQVGA